MSTVYFQDIIFNLQTYWSEQGCVLMQPHDGEVGAGTFHAATFLRAVGPEPWCAAYVQASRRPQDGRYGDNPNRLQHYYQFQTVMKPSPDNFQDLFLRSLDKIGVKAAENDIRFVEDDWESPTLGAWGLGWEVWLNGMEVAQFTYFQEVGGLTVKPVLGEITYGLERLAMFVQEKDNIFDVQWTENITYGELFRQNEKEQSAYNFERADTALLTRLFDDFENESRRLSDMGNDNALPLPAYELTMKCSHIFNLLDARGVISVTERARYVARVRNLARAVAKAYLESRKQQGYPLLAHIR